MKNNLILEKFAKELCFIQRPLVSVRSLIIELDFDRQQTKFNILDYIKQSKKSSRSVKLEKQIKPTLQYSIVGKCIKFHKRGLNSSFIIRNIISLTSFEMSFSFFTSFISLYIVRDFFKPTSRLHYKRSNQYYLRKVSPVRSRIVFDYVTDSSYDF